MERLTEMPELIKTQSVMYMIEMEDGVALFSNYTPEEINEEESAEADETSLRWMGIPGVLFAEMGCPEVLTMTLEVGDLLNLPGPVSGTKLAD